MRIVRSLALAAVSVLGLLLSTPTTANAEPGASSASDVASAGNSSTDPEDPGIPPTP